MTEIPEFIEPTSKEEALAALVHAWRIWEAMPHEEMEEDTFFKRYEDAAVKLGATEYELIRANFLGIPDHERKPLFLSYCFESLVDFQSIEVYIEHLGYMMKIRDEFKIIDPFSGGDL